MERKILPFKSSVDIGPAKHFVAKKTTMQLRRNTSIFLQKSIKKYTWENKKKMTSFLLLYLNSTQFYNLLHVN